MYNLSSETDYKLLSKTKKYYRFFILTILSLFIANISSAQTSAKKTGRLDLSNFKKSDVRLEEYIPEDAC